MTPSGGSDTKRVRASDRVQLWLDPTDLAHIIYAIKLAPRIEQPGPSTMRKLRRAFERAAQDWSEFER